MQNMKACALCVGRFFEYAIVTGSFEHFPANCWFRLFCPSQTQCVSEFKRVLTS